MIERKDHRRGEEKKNPKPSPLLLFCEITSGVTDAQHA
jgi:hypothetical protein